MHIFPRINVPVLTVCIIIILPNTVKPVQVDHRPFLKVVNINKWSTYTNVSQNNFNTRILFPASYLLMHIEIAQHINGDSYGEGIIICITTDLHKQHFFASFWSGKKLM